MVVLTQRPSVRPSTSPSAAIYTPRHTARGEAFDKGFGWPVLEAPEISRVHCVDRNVVERCPRAPEDVRRLGVVLRAPLQVLNVREERLAVRRVRPEVHEVPLGPLQARL